MCTHREIGQLRARIRQTQAAMIRDDENNPRFTSAERSKLTHAIICLRYAEDLLMQNGANLVKMHFNKAMELVAGIIDRIAIDPEAEVPIPQGVTVVNELRVGSP